MALVHLKNNTKKHYRGGDMSRPDGHRVLYIAANGGVAQTTEENAKRIMRDHPRGSFEVVRAPEDSE